MVITKQQWSLIYNTYNSVPEFNWSHLKNMLENHSKSSVKLSRKRRYVHMKNNNVPCSVKKISK